MPSTPSSPSRLLTFAGYYAFVLIGWNAVLLASLIRSIEHDFRQSDAAFGVLYLLGSLLYTTGAFSGGVLTERFGRKVVLPAGSISLAIGLVAQATAPSWLLFIGAMIFAGWGSGVIDGGINGLFLDLYRDARGGALNLLHTFFSIGALISPFFAGLFITAGLPWQAIMIGTATAALLLAATLAFISMPGGKRSDSPASTAIEELTAAERSLIPFACLAASIAFYVGAELGVSNWVVKLLSDVPVATATGVLSIFWGGMALGRFLSQWIAERLEYSTFTLVCITLSCISLAGAVLAPWLVVSAILFGLTGLLFGPIYPTIMAIGGNYYPHRLAALSGSLAGAAVIGSIAYPPLMGVMESHIGLQGGMFGAALLGIPMALGILFARETARRARMTAGETSAPPPPLAEGERGV